MSIDFKRAGIPLTVHYKVNVQIKLNGYNLPTIMLEE